MEQTDISLRVRYPEIAVSRLSIRLNSKKFSNKCIQDFIRELQANFPHFGAHAAYSVDEDGRIYSVMIMSLDNILDGEIKYDTNTPRMTADPILSATFNYRPLEKRDKEYKRLKQLVNRKIEGRFLGLY